jgi:hypothetical protein
MRGRSVIVVAAVFAAIGVAIGGWWIAADQRGDGRRPATTVTAHEAARVVARALVREFEAGRLRVPVLHCKLATPRQRYWCGSARRLTAAIVAAQILARPTGPHRTRCIVKSEEGDLWTIEAGPDGCRSWG